MRTQSPSHRLLVLPIVFALVCGCLLIATWRIFGGDLPLQPRDYRVQLTLPHATNLYPGADVRTAGVTIGQVDDVRRVGGSARTTITIRPRHAPLRAGATVMLRTKTLLGEGYLALAPGDPGAPEVPDGGSLPNGATLTSQRIDDVLATFDPATRRGLRTLVDGLSRSVAGRGADLSAILATTGPAVSDLETVATELDRDRRSLQQLLANGGDVFAALAERGADVQRALESGDRVLTVTAARRSALRQTLREVPPFLRQLRRSAAVISSATGDLDAATRALVPVATRARPTLDAIGRAAPPYQRLFTELAPAFRDIRAALPATRRVVRAAGPSLEQVHEGAREVLPLAQILTESRDSVVGSTANVASAMAGVVEGAQGQRLNYVAAFPTVWNETVGGWIKRLPSNRGNAYPAPGSARDIARGGLEAFDCRHTGNRLYLPPTGGTPPCVTQEPWTFNGVAAAYPRLKRSPP